jgi:MbtH protein
MSSERTYAVVVNDEGSYSIWPQGRPVPAGWHPEGTAGTEQQCAEHIDQVWTGLTPAALRGSRG